jgi:hypothetical protein
MFGQPLPVALPDRSAPALDFCRPYLAGVRLARNAEVNLDYVAGAV